MQERIHLPELEMAEAIGCSIYLGAVGPYLLHEMVNGCAMGFTWG